jgi:hypothetical protein
MANKIFYLETSGGQNSNLYSKGSYFFNSTQNQTTVVAKGGHFPA